jgi:hypothetical protein
MPSFPYVARTPNGTLERGVVDASSLEAAKAQIHAKGWTIEEMTGDSVVGFSEAIPAWTTTDTAPAKAAGLRARGKKDVETPIAYIPMTQTLRLFAGWLMAWYGIIYLAGTYRADGRLPYDIPLIQSLASSELVLRFSFAVFLFLLLTDIHKWTGKNATIGVLLGIIGIGLMWVFHINV